MDRERPMKLALRNHNTLTRCDLDLVLVSTRSLGDSIDLQKLV